MLMNMEVFEQVVRLQLLLRKKSHPRAPVELSGAFDIVLREMGYNIQAMDLKSLLRSALKLMQSREWLDDDKPIEWIMEVDMQEVLPLVHIIWRTNLFGVLNGATLILVLHEYVKNPLLRMLLVAIHAGRE